MKVRFLRLTHRPHRPRRPDDFHQPGQARSPGAPPLPTLPSPMIVAVLVALVAPAPPAMAARDPFEPPAAARVRDAAPRTAAPSAAAPSGEPASEPPAVRHIVTLEGRHFLVVGARRYATGERLASWRIECIHDRGAVLRDDAGRVQRLSLFGSVAIRPSAVESVNPVSTGTTAPACADSATPPVAMKKRTSS